MFLQRYNWEVGREALNVNSVYRFVLTVFYSIKKILYSTDGEIQDKCSNWEFKQYTHKGETVLIPRH